MRCMPPWQPAAITPDTSQLIAKGILTIIPRECPTGMTEMCCNEHPRTILRDVKKTNSSTCDDRYFLEENGSWTDVQPHCVRDCVSFAYDWTKIFGIHTRILMYYWTQLPSKSFQTLCTFLGTNNLTTTAYHLETNKLTERFNKKKITRLQNFVEENQRDWDISGHALGYA